MNLFQFKSKPQKRKFKKKGETFPPEMFDFGKKTG